MNKGACKNEVNCYVLETKNSGPYQTGCASTGMPNEY